MTTPTLETYVSVPREIVVGGKTLQITPLRVRQIPAFLREVGPAGSLLMGGNVAQAVALHGEGIARAMAVATGESEDSIGDLLPDAFLELVGVVMEVNADFFGQRVAPQIAALQKSAAARMTATKATHGETPSPSLSDTATA